MDARWLACTTLLVSSGCAGQDSDDDPGRDDCELLLGWQWSPSEGCTCPDTVCGEWCVDLTTDFHHCGACDRTCDGAGPFDRKECVGGECTCVNDECDGACTDVRDDPGNCGTCGTVCAAETPYCVHGVCGRCPVPLMDCGGDCIDVINSRANCGACDRACGPNAVCLDAVCVEGTSDQCTPACDADAGSLCCEGSRCVDVFGDAESCGACGRSCEGAYAYCELGDCMFGGK
jgi:hypothetical protein